MSICTVVAHLTSNNYVYRAVIEMSTGPAASWCITALPVAGGHAAPYTYKKLTRV